MNKVRIIVISMLLCAGVATWALPKIGEWDGVTASAKLDGPYEDVRQANVPFGIISYFNMPWRAYMDTWSAAKYLEVPGAQWNIDAKYAEAIGQLMEESGIVSVRYELGWGNLDWNDKLPVGSRENIKKAMTIFKKHGIRPLVLLNAHHGVPCPMKNVPVEIVEAAKVGDHTVKVKDATGIRFGYTGFPNPQYIAACPFITSADADGTLHLSTALGSDIPVGNYNLQELKYLPFQGTVLKDGTPVPAAQETFDGWKKFVAEVADAIREGLETKDQPDCGFDVEVWNEYTFGSNFLNINNYYDKKFEYAEEYVYKTTRPRQPQFSPDARVNFEVSGVEAILPIAVDYITDPASGFPGVRVISGLANQRPWENGTGLWAAQNGFSRHFYTGGWVDCSPENQMYQKNVGAIDALGNFDGERDNKDWHTIIPFTDFVPTMRVGMPEFYHTGFKTEMMTRDLIPDSRLAYMAGHGRYTHNGDFNPATVWMSEVNYYRRPFYDQLTKEHNISYDDPRLAALDEHMTAKMLLRQYIFHGHKGVYRMIIYCLNKDPYSFGMLTPELLKALDENNYELNDKVRAEIPPLFTGLAWLKTNMSKGEKIEAPRPLRVDELVEYKPRLVMEGKGTPSHPHRWNRDEFAFLPFQINAQEYLIPYYVVTLDVSRSWDDKKEPTDPTRYDMPEQDFDVTIGNICGKGATVEAYDPISNVAVPVTIVKSSDNTLTVKLKTVDYPRILRVKEAKVGPQILEPKIVLDEEGNINIDWKSNIPATASITYGRGWVNRGANEIALADKAKSFSTQIPTDDKTAIIAVRISLTANGLTDVWPRWDEDPRGQIVINGEQANAPVDPGVKPADSPFDLTKIDKADGEAIPKPVGIAYPGMARDETGKYALPLPKGLTLSGAANDRQGTSAGINYRIQYLPRAAATAGDYLPILSTVDTMERSVVRFDERRALHLAYHLTEAAHPGMSNLEQRFLLVRIGNDLLMISTTGSIDAMKKQLATITGMFAGLQIAE